MLEGINIFLPTKGRPDRLRKFLASMKETADDVDRLHVVLVIDIGDIDTVKVVEEECDDRVAYQIIWNLETKAPHLARFYNRCYAETERWQDNWAVSMFGDDMVFVSKGWDTAFLDALNENEGVAIVYGDDDYIQHEKMCVHLVTSRALVRMTGHEFMAGFAADMIDTVWYVVGKKCGLLCYLEDVHIRHEHNGQLKPEHRDDTWKRLQKVKLPQAAGHKKVEGVADAIAKNLKEVGYARR
jgi:hypothetical protein